jgi:hypothetical protein
VSPELRLVATCCRWPADGAREKAISGQLEGNVNWMEVERLAAFHRVEGLVAHGVRPLAEVVPSANLARFERAAEAVRITSIRDLGESLRIARVLTDAGIEYRFLKGAALGVAAYGTPTLKHSTDIDLLVLPKDAVAAAAYLESLGYKPILPPRRLDAEEFARWSIVSKEAEFRSDRGTTVDLHWRVSDHPQLLHSIDATSPPRAVDVLEADFILTLSDATNLAYLSVHGAAHAWFRLKWLADFNGLLNSFDNSCRALRLAEASKLGVGDTLNAALRLSANLFYEATIDNDERASTLVAICVDAICASDEGAAGCIAKKARWRLAPSWRFRWAEVRVRWTGTLDRLEHPLPQGWHFLYVWLRIPFLVHRKLVDLQKM